MRTFQRTMKGCLVLFLVSLAVGSSTAQHNTLSQKEMKEGWKLLFDGKSTAGWRNYNQKFIGKGWQVSNGELWLDASLGKSGDILFEKEFENFELVLDWKIDSCGNSGIFFNVKESTDYEDGWHTGPEMQILANDCNEDGKYPKHRSGNLYDLVASTVESVKVPGEWNTVRIFSNKGHVEMWLNGVKQVEITMFTPEWEAMIKKSKFAIYPDFGKFRRGYIMLQDHDYKVWFRNIKIREL